MTSRFNILNLPMEVLELVFKALPDMKDKLNLAKAHDVLGKAFALDAGDRFKKIEFEDRPNREWSFILSLCGSSVTRILSRAVNTTVSCVALAAKYCPNLEEFFFPVRSNFWNHIKPLLLTLKNLKWIGLTNNYEKINVVDTLLQMPKLVHLQLVGFNRKDWETVGKLVNLTELTIMNKLDEQIDIFKVCSPLKNLDSLELKFAYICMPNNLGDEPLLPKIDLLRINVGFFHTSLPYLPTLKFLTIDSVDPRTKLNDIFGESVFKYAKTLESLRFCIALPRIIDVDELGIICKLRALKRLDCQVGSDDFMEYISLLEHMEQLILQNSYMTNRGALMVIYRCKKLRDLDIFGCPLVNKEMVIEAVPFLFLSGVKPDNPFVLHVGPHFGYVDKSELHGVLDIKHACF